MPLKACPAMPPSAILTTVAPVTNISCYAFVRLDDLPSLRDSLLALCRRESLKGTILLGREGINLFVAGSQNGITSLLANLRSVPGLETVSPKVSHSDHQPFTRMIVRIKKEIIAFGVEGIAPASHTSPKLPAQTLKQWLDEGRRVTLLDTRNDYEVRLGTFEGATDLGIRHFRQFPDAISKLPAELKTTPIVMFCTGGIRCEKAGPLMEREGFHQVFQLDGGILKYFEECGGAHYRGECFVFDQRVGVDPALRETDSALCFVCQAPLTAAEQADPRYSPGQSCPYCHRSPEEKMRDAISLHEAAIRKFTTPLPGSIPYENSRPVLVPPDCEGFTLLDFLCKVFPHQPREKWSDLCESGRFVSPAGATAPASQIVRSGERYHLRTPDLTEPPVNPDVRILHLDEAVIVLAKPAPLPMHPAGRFNKNTLQSFLAHAFAPQRPRPAHRLDANTSGVVVWTRTRHFARLLQPQFEAGTVKKTYVARVHGHPHLDEFSCDTPISNAPGPVGTRRPDPTEGRPARTDFRTLLRLPDGTSLVEATPLTGRTNQIRIHLMECGLPVCGDPSYNSASAPSLTMTLHPADPPLCLHAWNISFTHPLTGECSSFEAPTPPWASQHQQAEIVRPPGG